MASRHNVHCKCGFNKSIEVGGTMFSFTTHSYFPFYCKGCGLVNVNIARKKHVCPSCKSQQVNQYGLPPLSLKSETYKVIMDGDYSASSEGHFCPNCNEFNLIFSESSMLLD